jgi:protein gp37
MANTGIEYGQVAWNPVTGCTKISEACQNCWAERMSKRLAGRCGYDKDEPFKVTLHPDRLDQPLKWKKPRTVLVSFMGDLFHEDVPTTFIDQVLEIIASCPQHTFLALTKRPENLEHKIYGTTTDNPFRQLGGGDYLANLWLGVTAENQARADERIPILLQIPAAKRFVSVEPMLGPVDLTQIDIGGNVWINSLTGDCKSYHPYGGMWKMSESKNKLDWVICGGESGPGARPMHPDWVRSLRDQCITADVPFWFKQWGEYCAPSQMPPETYRAWDYHHGTENCWKEDDPSPWRVGKKKAGRLLDGQEWQQKPRSTCRRCLTL